MISYYKEGSFVLLWWFTPLNNDETFLEHSVFFKIPIFMKSNGTYCLMLLGALVKLIRALNKESRIASNIPFCQRQARNLSFVSNLGYLRISLRRALRKNHQLKMCPVINYLLNIK